MITGEYYFYPTNSSACMSYQSSWRSPSNIALIKYWGKKDPQLPLNPSLSFTLSKCYTEMTVFAEMETGFSLKVMYDGTPKPSFEQKINAFFKKLDTYYPWLKNASIVIESKNTFPHGAGIASSASAMSALALCLQSIHEDLNEKKPEVHNWLQHVSEIARLGSGSACRSVFPVAALWGKTPIVQDSRDQYAISWKENIAPVFHTMQDAILIISDEEKSVSSSAGHQLMENHPYAESRYTAANNNLHRLIDCLEKEEGMTEFISIVESEALQLHAMMMSGHIPYLLIKPNTLNAIQEIWRFRKETSIPVCFTLDAGPNIHILYPAEYATTIEKWINSHLVEYCTGGRVVFDHVGSGPGKLI